MIQTDRVVLEGLLLRRHLSRQQSQNQPCIFTGRTDAEAEAPILWPPDAKNFLIGKDPDAGKD